MALTAFRRVPFIPQMEMAECGAASLAMVLAYHGKHLPLVEVRQACGVSRDGASASALLEAAEGYGMTTSGYRAEPDDLHALELPAILHWSLNHFVVLERIGRRSATIVDPAVGRMSIRRSRLAQEFTGIALEMTPGPEFATQPRPRSTLARYTDLLRDALPALGLVLGASLMLELFALVLPVANQLLIDQVILPHRESWLWGLGLALAGAVVLSGTLALLRGWVLQTLQTRLDVSLMAAFTGHLLHLPMSFFTQRKPGDLVQRLQSNTAIRDVISGTAVTAVLDVFLLTGYAALMFAYNVRLAAVVLLTAAIRVALLLAMRDRTQQAVTSATAASGAEAGALVEALSVIETVKGAGAEERMVARWADRRIETLNRSIDRRRLTAGFGQVMVVLDGAALALILWIGGQEVLDLRMTFGMFGAFIAMQSLFARPLEAILSALLQFQVVSTHLQRIDDVLDAPREPAGEDRPDRFHGSIRFEGVSFRHALHAPWVLDAVDLTIEAGEKVAIVGPSGAGKSTLLQLLLGIHQPQRGTIFFDGVPLSALEPAALRRQVAVVLQDTFLFDDTVRANLSLSDPELPLERLREAARIACVDDVIEALPHGFDTVIGEQGGRLSGGQRQRLAIARAVAQDPAVLLLDEATRSLDRETEQRVAAQLRAFGRTTIVVAHRLATVREADRILVLSGGRIAQQGTFAALAAEPGVFRSLVDAAAQSDDAEIG